MGGKGRTGIGHSEEQKGSPEAEDTSGRPTEELPDCALSFSKCELSGTTGGGRGNGWAVRKQGDREREFQGGTRREDELGLLDFEGS